MSPVYIISFTIFGCISFCIVWISKRSSLWGHVMLCSVNFSMTYDTMLCELCWEIWCDALWFMLICVQMNSFLYCQQQRSKYILLRTKFIMQWRKELNKIITAEKKINKTTQYHRYLQDPETRSSFLRDSSKQVPGCSSRPFTTWGHIADTCSFGPPPWHSRTWSRMAPYCPDIPVTPCNIPPSCSAVSARQQVYNRTHTQQTAVVRCTYSRKSLYKVST